MNFTSKKFLKGLYFKFMDFQQLTLLISKIKLQKDSRGLNALVSLGHVFPEELPDKTHYPTGLQNVITS